MSKNKEITVSENEKSLQILKIVVGLLLITGIVVLVVLLKKEGVTVGGGSGSNGTDPAIIRKKLPCGPNSTPDWCEINSNTQCLSFLFQNPEVFDDNPEAKKDFENFIGVKVGKNTKKWVDDNIPVETINYYRSKQNEDWPVGFNTLLFINPTLEEENVPVVKLTNKNKIDIINALYLDGLETIKDGIDGKTVDKNKFIGICTTGDLDENSTEAPKQESDIALEKRAYSIQALFGIDYLYKDVPSLLTPNDIPQIYNNPNAYAETGKALRQVFVPESSYNSFKEKEIFKLIDQENCKFELKDEYLNPT